MDASNIDIESVINEDLEILPQSKAGGDILQPTFNTEELIDIFGLTEHAYELISNLPSDSKLDATIKYLTNRANNDLASSFFISCNFQRTADYIASALRLDFDNVFSVKTHQDLEITLTTMTKEKCIVILTMSVIKGYEFPNASDLILYDTPTNFNNLFLLLTRFRPSRPATHINVVSVESVDNIVPDSLLKKFGFKDIFNMYANFVNLHERESERDVSGRGDDGDA